MSGRRGWFQLGWLALGVVAALAPAREASARPTYFQVLTSQYGIQSTDRTYACGNCHIKWTGTGARNPFGTAVEQQLYVGKSISQALTDIEPMDADSDGFSNFDELVTHQTLPGYSCDNFFIAEGAPIGYDTFITPGVPSCLEPIDIRVEPNPLGFITKAGTVDTLPLHLINNGSTDPITITSFGFLAGNHPALSVTGPAVPFDIPVGQVVDLEVSFAPVSAALASGTLRIESNDPDEGVIDRTINGFGFVQVLAPADKRAKCLKSIDGQFRRYADRHRREWNRCFADEVKGLACDVGTRDLKIQQAETHFRAAVGGAKDKVCAGQNLSGSLLGLPSACGGGCNITVGSIASFASCLICREDEARDTMLRDGVGTAPPDVPPNVAGNADANRCEKQITTRLAKGIANIQKLLARCELANITSGSPVDCAATNAEAIAAFQAKVDEAGQRCVDSTGLLGCLFEGGDAQCLGTSAAATAGTLVDATFGLTP